MDKFINICEADIQKKKFGKFVKTLRTPNVKVFICAFKQKNGFVPNIFICSKKKKKKKRKEGEKKNIRSQKPILTRTRVPTIIN